MNWILQITLFLFIITQTDAFLSRSTTKRYSSSSGGIALKSFEEWRHLEISIRNSEYNILGNNHNNINSSSSSSNSVGNKGGTTMPSSASASAAAAVASSLPPPLSLRPLSILPRTYSDLLLPGETTYLQFVEEEELQVFQMATNYHKGIFGLGLVSSNEVDVERSMLATMPILEIQEYNNMKRYGLGVFCTARVVGKVKIHQVFWSQNHNNNNHHHYYHYQQRQPFQALVYDAHDNVQTTTATATTTTTTTTMKNTKIMAANQVADGIELLVSNLARWEKSNNDENDADGDDDDDAMTVLDQFWNAYNTVLESDRQMYQISLTNLQQQQILRQRSWRELNAISWAAFACSKQDSRQRLEAFYTTDILRRLQIARNWLSGIRIVAMTKNNNNNNNRVQ